MQPTRHSAQVQHAPQRWAHQQQQSQQSALGPLGSPTAPLSLSMQSSPFPAAKDAHSPRSQLPLFLAQPVRRTQQQQQQAAHVPQYPSGAAPQQQLFLSPIMPHKQAMHMQAHTPLTAAFTPHVAATPAHHSAAGLNLSHSSSLFSASSSASSQGGSVPGSAEQSFADNDVASFTSPIHPHHLSFDAAASPVSLSASPLDLSGGDASAGEKGLASPVPLLAPFAFASQVSPQRSDADDSASFPVMQNRPVATATAQQAQQTQLFGLLPPLMAESTPHSPDSSSSSAAALSSCPFVSPMVVRSVGLHGTPLHPSALGSGANGASGAVVHPRTLPRSIHLPSTAAGSSLNISTHHRHLGGGGASAGPASAGTGGSGRSSGHHRSSSSSDAQPLLMRRDRGGRGGPLLNSKRHRGSSMDLQAERDSGAVLQGFGVVGTGYGSAFTSAHQRSAQAAAAASEAYDPLCPASAITQSMRKLRVKKSALPSPARRGASSSGGQESISEHGGAGPTTADADADDEMEMEMETEMDAAVVPCGQPARRSSGFSSSDEDESVSPSIVPASAAPASLNLKQQRRARALQSIHKKRAAILAEHSTPAPGALTLGLGMQQQRQDDDERERGQAQLVQALAAAAASSAAFQNQHLVLPQAPGFVVHSPLRRRRDAQAAEEEMAATPALNLQIAIPDGNGQQRQMQLHNSAMMSPPAAAAATGTGRCLSWSDDDDEEGASGAPSMLSSAASTAMRMPMPSSSTAGFSLTGSAARMRAAQAELEVPEEDVGAVATVLRFGDDSDDDDAGAHAHAQGQGHDGAEEDEGADLIGEDMGLIVPAANEAAGARSTAAFLSHRRRRSSMGALVAPEGFMLGVMGAQSMQLRGGLGAATAAATAAEATTPTHAPSAPARWGSGSGYGSGGYGSGSGSGNRYSPVPHHTPLTPTASNLPLSPPFSGSNWGSGSGFPATPLPLLPAMRMPESRLPEELAAAAAEAAAASKQQNQSAGGPALSLSIEEGDAGLTEMDFRSPVNTGSHHLTFPTMAGATLQQQPHPLGLAPVPGMGEDAASPAGSTSATGLPGSFSITLERHGSAARPAAAAGRERRASTPSSDLSTPPMSPRFLSAGGASATSLAQSLASMSPDPKAFQESRSLQPRRAAVQMNFSLTPMRQGPSGGSLGLGLGHGSSGLSTRGSGPGVGLLGAELGLGLGLHGHGHKQLQPPPTPVRPSSIKRLRASASAAAAAALTGAASTPAKKPPSSRLQAVLSSVPSAANCSSPPPASSAHLFGIGAAGMTAESGDAAAASGSANGSGNNAPFAPTLLPSCHSRTRLERTSSLYDSKVLIDFKAALAAAAAAKAQRLALAQNTESVEEDADHAMADGSGSGAGSSPAHGSAASASSAAATGASAVAATPGPRSLAPPPTPASAQQLQQQGALILSSPMPQQQNLQGSIWDSGFTNKVLVGTGSFFETFRCQSCDKSDPVRSDEYGQFFAVKRSLKPFRGKRDRGLYLREVALMESLGSHENIVRHIRAWQEDMHFFIQMEYCPMNLTQYVASLHATQQAEALSRGELSPTAVAGGTVSLTGLSDSLLKNITLQLASALQHIHQRGLVHLDIKPDNILISFGGIVRLADFGQARLLKPLDGSASTTVGTGAAVCSAAAAALALCPDFDMDGVEGDCQYMSPELLGGPDVARRNGGGLEPVPIGPSAACDIFSLGLTLVELASGAVLPKSGLLWHELRDGRAGRHIHGRVSAVMEHIILNLLEPHPKDRPTAKQIVQWINAHS